MIIKIILEDEVMFLSGEDTSFSINKVEKTIFEGKTGESIAVELAKSISVYTDNGTMIEHIDLKES